MSIVTVGGAAIGVGGAARWYSVKSSYRLTGRETHIKVWLNISEVPGGYQAIIGALEQLQNQGDILSYNPGVYGKDGMAVEVVCMSGHEVVHVMYTTRRYESQFTRSICNRLISLLDQK